MAGHRCLGEGCTRCEAAIEAVQVPPAEDLVAEHDADLYDDWAMGGRS